MNTNIINGKLNKNILAAWFSDLPAINATVLSNLLVSVIYFQYIMSPSDLPELLRERTKNWHMFEK